MYAAAYQTLAGFGSVGFLAGFDRRGERLRIADPIFGYVTISAEDAFCVIDTEGGAVLPGVVPILGKAEFSEWLVPGAERMVANRKEVEQLWLIGQETGEMFPSGYPHAWEFIKHWREAVAPDWRTIALAAIFARTTIQRPIEEAEALYREFGPTMRDALLRGHTPTHKEMLRFRGIKGTRAAREAEGLDDLASYLAIFEWAPWVTEQMSKNKKYDRSFRDTIAVEYVPWGVGMAKLSFTMMLTGRDAACLDTRMLEYFFQDDDKGRARFLSGVSQRSKAKGARGILNAAVKRYRGVEDELEKTEFFDPKWPQPYAKAQWMLWETLGRTAGTANHGALWEVIGPLMEEISR